MSHLQVLNDGLGDRTSLKNRTRTNRARRHGSGQVNATRSSLRRVGGAAGLDGGPDPYSTRLPRLAPGRPAKYVLALELLNYAEIGSGASRSLSCLTRGILLRRC